MAETMAWLAVRRTSNLLAEEGTFLSGVSNEVVQLKAELNRMNCFLSEIRDLVFQAENVLELFVAQVESKRGTGLKKIVKRVSAIFTEAITCHRVGVEIQNIKTKISNLTQSLQTYGIREIHDGESSNSAQRWLRQTYPHEAEEDFVGLEDDMNKIVSCLMDDGTQYKVVALWGMGGLGKTTLAKKIYNLIDVRRHFEAFAWVCITQQCQPKQVLQDVVRELVPCKIVNDMTDRELVQQLYKIQQERKCLVVLDDVWTMEAWNILCHAFPIKGTAARSKLLLTTRTKRVAERGYLHHVRCLNEDEGWELLQKKAFPGATYAPDFKMDISMEKLARGYGLKCGGLPLAISVIGGILRNKPTVTSMSQIAYS